MAVDGSGNAYIAGDASSTNFPTTVGAYQRTYASGGSGGFAVGDAFVAKFNPSLSGSASLVYSTYLGGGDGYVSDIGPNSVVLNDNGEKDGPALAVDSSGNAYVAGTTNSGNFPTTAGAFQTKFHGGTADAFMTKLNPTGSALVYSTLLGGSNMDGAKAIALDASGNAYVTGYTRSTDFPLLNPLQSQKASGNDNWGNPNSDVFVATLNASGSALLFSTYLGGSSNDNGNGIAVNSAGDAYVMGGAAAPTSSNFPTTPGAYQTTSGNGFIFMIDPPVEQAALLPLSSPFGNGSTPQTDLVLTGLPSAPPVTIPSANSASSAALDISGSSASPATVLDAIEQNLNQWESALAQELSLWMQTVDQLLADWNETIRNSSGANSVFVG